jgi:hypothetical protein
VTKTDLLLWLRTKKPPLVAVTPAIPDPSGNGPTWERAAWRVRKTEYNEINAVTTAAEARTALMVLTPPLTPQDVEAGMVEYAK